MKTNYGKQKENLRGRRKVGLMSVILLGGVGCKCFYRDKLYSANRFGSSAENAGTFQNTINMNYSP